MIYVQVIKVQKRIYLILQINIGQFNLVKRSRYSHWKNPNGCIFL